MYRLLDLIRRVPGLQQLLLLLGIAAAVAVGIGLYMELRSPDYTTVVAGAPDVEAAQITGALQQAGIAYRLDAMGDVEVPSDQAGNARITLGAKNLPAAPFGMQSLTETSGFGISQFMEHTRYNYALENDLAHTIGAVDGVAHAYVHLALPQPSAFVDAQDTPSASVMVELAPGATLDSAQVSAITHLVAASVPDLKASHVTVIDQSGQLLSDQSTQSALGQTAAQMQLTRQLERNLDNKIVALLTPLVGVGDVQVQASADVDYADTNEASETYHPDPKAIRSQTLTSDGSASTLPQGVPGAFSNQPQVPTPAAPPAGTQPVTGTSTSQPPSSSPGAPRNTSESTQYAISRSIKHTVGGPGQVQRLAVAVLVSEPSTHAAKDGDSGKPAAAARPFTSVQLANMTALVKSAVGYDPARGDVVTVVAAPFAVRTGPQLKPLAGPSWWEQPWVVPLIRDILAALAILVIGLVVIRPAMRTLLVGPDRGVRVADAVAEIRHAAQHEAAVPDVRAEPSYDDKLNIAHTAVTQDPKRVAQVVKTWVNDDG